jgi:hypothetical protein
MVVVAVEIVVLLLMFWWVTTSSLRAGRARIRAEMAKMAATKVGKKSMVFMMETCDGAFIWS